MARPRFNLQQLKAIASALDDGPVFSSGGAPPDITAPVLVGNPTINAAGTKAILTYSEALDPGSVPALGDFALTGTALAALTGTPAVVGATIELSLTPAVFTEDSGITISYTPGASPIQDLAGNDAAALVGQAVTNGSTNGFVPTAAPGLAGWFDMQDAGSYTQAGTVTSITNKASGVVANTALSAFPNYSAAGFNGRPCMAPSGVAQAIAITEAALVAAFTDTPAYTVFGAVQQDVPDSNQAWFGFGNSGAAANNAGYFGSNTTGAGVWLAGLRNNGGTALNVESSGANNANANIQEWLHTGAAVSLLVNGADADPSGAPQDAATVTVNRCAIACLPRATPAIHFAGKIGEILIYTVALSAALRAVIRKYLGTKWGVVVA